MPNSTTPLAFMASRRATTSSSSAASSAKLKADTATHQALAAPSTMASAAPKAAASDRPSVNGLASGLSSTVCISAPASPKAARCAGRRERPWRLYWSDTSFTMLEKSSPPRPARLFKA